MKFLKNLVLLAVLVVSIKSQITEQECKRDCTLDFSDCSHLCQQNGKPECYQRCSKLVKACIAECPKLVCLDFCRIDFEKCRDNEEVECDGDYNECQDGCERKAQVVKDEI